MRINRFSVKLEASSRNAFYDHGQKQRYPQNNVHSTLDDGKDQFRKFEPKNEVTCSYDISWNSSSASRKKADKSTGRYKNVFM